MLQCILFSSVFLVFVLSDVYVVVNSAETKDDDANIKADSTFSEVIKNITRVNNVLQELIKNYEKLQKIYHSQESIEQHEYDEENSSEYSNVKRSKDISTPGKSKDFPATNIPYSESEASPEKVNEDNKISKEKPQDSRVPATEIPENDNSIDRVKKRSKKEKTTKEKDAKSQVPVVTTYTSGELAHDKLAKEQNNPMEAKEIDEHEAIKNQKQSVEQTKQNVQAEKKGLLDQGSEEKLNVNASDVKPDPPTNAGKIIDSKLVLVVGDRKEEKRDAADSENEVQYEQRKRLDDNDKVFHRFTTESKDDDKGESVPNLKSRYVQKPKKPTSDTSVRSSAQKKHKTSLRSTQKPSSIGKKEKETQKKTTMKEEKLKKKTHKVAKESPKKRTQKDDSSQKESGTKKNNPENGGSSEDEKSIKKEQFKTSILRKAYGDACLKVVVKKCYKACKGTLKRGCRRYKCKSNFQLQFKEHAKTGCIREFREAPATPKATTVVVALEPDKGALKTVDKPKVKARDIDKNTDGFLDMTRNGYLAAACLPKTRRADAAPGTRAHQLNILRDRFERECQKVSCSKCTKACTYAVDQTCSTHNCTSEKKKGLRKVCSKECKDSYSASSKKKKNKSSGSSGSGSGSGSGSDSSGSGSGSDSDESYSKSSKSKEHQDKTTTHEATTTTTTTHETTTSTVTKKDDTLRKRVSDKKDEARVRVRGVDKKS